MNLLVSSTPWKRSCSIPSIHDMEEKVRSWEAAVSWWVLSSFPSLISLWWQDDHTSRYPFSSFIYPQDTNRYIREDSMGPEDGWEEGTAFPCWTGYDFSLLITVHMEREGSLRLLRTLRRSSCPLPGLSVLIVTAIIWVMTVRQRSGHHSFFRTPERHLPERS